MNNPTQIVSNVFAVAFLCLFSGAVGQQDVVLTYEEYYQFGKQSYTEKNWPDCVGYMKRAIDDFRYFEDELVSCRKKCAKLVARSASQLKTLQNHEASELALCLIRCRRDRLGETRPGIRKMSVYYDMMERKPYQYMHICYWKQGELAMATQSAYTFLTRNAGDKDAIASIDFYMNQVGFTDSMLLDAERSEYEARFINGVAAYDEQDWSRCVSEFEIALDKSLLQDERCRYLCEDKIDWAAAEGNPEVDVLLASMRASVTRCQYNCLYKLGVINGHYVGQLLAAHFEYLHFCQYKLMRGSDAAQSVANYLLFDDNPLMRRNKHFYLQLYGKGELFQPDERMIKLHKQRELEKRYLDFVEKRFVITDNELPPEQADDHKPLDLDVDLHDEFPYSQVPQLLKADECELLRSVFPKPTTAAFKAELTSRVRAIWKKAKFESVTCGQHMREAKCPRAIVLSVDRNDCSEWLGRWFTGCAVVFCD